MFSYLYKILKMKKKWLVYLNKWMKELSLIQFWILKTFKFFRSILKWFIQTHAQEIQWILAYCKMHILNYSTKHNHHIIIALHQFNGWISLFTYYLASKSIFIYLNLVVFQQRMFKSWLLVYADALKVTVHCRNTMTMEAHLLATTDSKIYFKT